MKASDLPAGGLDSQAMTPEEFDRIFREHGPLVWSIIRKFGLKGSDTEDLFIEIWEAVWKSLDSFSGRAKLSTWVGGVARNKCLDRLGRRNGYPLDETGSLRRREKLLIAGQAADPFEPRKNQLRRETRALIGSILKKLPPVQATIVKRWMDGFSYEEIAEILNAFGSDPVDAGYVGKQLYLAKKQIAASFREAGIERFEDIWE